MGLIAEIHRSNIGDCSNGGISGRAHAVCLVNVSGPFDPDDERYPAAMLVDGNLPGTIKVVPAVLGDDDEWVEQRGGVGPMMGGCYVATSDSRFSQACEEFLGHRFYGAVPLHDRFETQAQYDANFN